MEPEGLASRAGAGFATPSWVALSRRGPHFSVLPVPHLRLPELPLSVMVKVGRQRRLPAV